MKSIVFVLIVVVSLAVMSEAASPVRCPGTCNTSECSTVENCACGTNKDECDCCSFCNKCPGEACSLIQNHRCSEGYSCHYESTDPSYMNENDGVCTQTA